ncbi:MYG1 exonuclease [Marchantia polymorpha subsp. ruderalis]|uniref:Metal-dependent protein hydrolase n=3 Tax=Marchantia polymorpha TaxID=3197 RepID=A0AAF6ARW0_MARPO|nr:hypothetical protein MARPO_0001s0278 [Marchantia polymorpha]BBM99180.1 hypothetical protein Mp_1g19390 [Marchantia polymorpha subsp. ruderalis]|eukprot:PTQ50258.1 hypothetical protein MARPO_0001s0278 [Marchantia polymorpha]
MWSRGLSSLCARHSRICLSATVFQPLELPLLSSWRFLEGNAIASRVVMTGTSQVAASVADFSTAGTLKRKQEKKVGTHNGTFHCDEALGCFMIRLTEKFAGAEIVRTRDQKILDALDAVLDVGGIYNPATDRYDHHQRGFDQVFGHGFSTKLSSAGLVYKHFGEEIVAKELGLDKTHPDVQKIYLAVYKSFMEAIDGVDNGVNQYDTDLVPKYVNDTHLSARVGRLNPDWMDEQTAEKEDEAFHQAMDLTGKEFMESLSYYAKSWLPARSIVAESLAARMEAHESGEIMILKQFCPWKQHLFEIESEQGLNPTIKYVVYEDERSGQWRVQAVAVAPGKFESRKPLPVQWRGLRDDELSKECGIDGCVFVHMSGFIGGAKSFSGTLEMARKALSF